MQNRMKMAVETVIMPPTVPPIAGPIKELGDTFRARNVEKAKLTDCDCQRMW
jgi:hypothetical protein